MIDNVLLNMRNRGRIERKKPKNNDLAGLLAIDDEKIEMDVKYNAYNDKNNQNMKASFMNMPLDCAAREITPYKNTKNTDPIIIFRSANILARNIVDLFAL
jgi:hypothetical protein